MVDFTESDLLGRFKDEIARLEVIHQFLVSGATEFSSLMLWNQAVNSGAFLNHLNSITQNTTNLRNSLSALVSPDAVATRLNPYLLNYRDLLDLPNNSSTTQIIQAIYEHYEDTAQTLTARDIAYGSPIAGGSNQGDGVLYRYRTDKNGYALGYAWADEKTITCTSDANSGATKFKEQFQIVGGNAEQLYFEQLSDPTGTIGTINALIAENGDIIKNANFFAISDTSVLTDTTQSVWTVNSGSVNDWTIDTTDWYNAILETSAQCLVCSGNSTLIQPLTNQQGGRLNFSTTVPYHIQLSVKPQDFCDREIYFRVGTIEATVEANTLVSGAWDVLLFSSGTNGWFENFNTESITVEFGCRSGTTGSVKFSNLVCKPCTAFGNQFYALPSGETRFKLDDEFTITDAVQSTDGMIWKWFSFAYPGILNILPQAGSGTIADPSLLV